MVTTMTTRDQMIDLFERLLPENQREALAYAQVALAAEASAMKCRAASPRPPVSAGAGGKRREKKGGKTE